MVAKMIHIGLGQYQRLVEVQSLAKQSQGILALLALLCPRRHTFEGQKESNVTSIITEQSSGVALGKSVLFVIR